MFETERVPVTLFQSTDKSAPQLTNAAGSFKTVLKACLVTGYGDKSALGWEGLFEEDNKMAFRSKHAKSSKCCLSVDNTENKVVKISGFETLTSTTEGEGVFGEYRNVPYYPSDNSAGARKWWLIGHGRAFVFVYQGYYTGTSRFLYFGDFYSAAAGDNHNCICMSNYESGGYLSSSSGTTLTGHSSYAPRCVARSFDGLARNIGMMCIGAFFTSDKGVYPNPISGGFSASEIYLKERLGEGYGIRGLLGGLFYSFDELKSIPEGTIISNMGSTGDQFIKFNLYDTSSSIRMDVIINASYWEI